jgi:hypothetical protein
LRHGIQVVAPNYSSTGKLSPMLESFTLEFAQSLDYQSVQLPLLSL